MQNLNLRYQPWTEEEDQKILEIFEQTKDVVKRRKLCQKFLPNREWQTCLTRFYIVRRQVAGPSRVKISSNKRWTHSEDKLLYEGFNQFITDVDRAGFVNEFLPGRSYAAAVTRFIMLQNTYVLRELQQPGEVQEEDKSTVLIDTQEFTIPLVEGSSVKITVLEENLIVQIQIPKS